MLKNYIKTALRTLYKNKIYSSINILGLALGIATCILVLLFVRYEWSFDDMHVKADRIYRLNEIQSYPGTATQHVALSAFPMAPTLKADYPEVEAFVRIRGGETIIGHGQKQIVVEHGFYADASFFDLFDFKLLEPSDQTELSQPHQAVLTRETAALMFGTEKVIGRTINVDENDFIITGLMEPTPPNSHLQIDALFSMATIDSERRMQRWGSNSFVSYMLLAENANAMELENKFPVFIEKYMGEASAKRLELYLQPLKEIHLGSAAVTHDYRNWLKFDEKYVHVFIILASFVLLIASINFMNITTSRASTRAKEIGVRKSIGAFRFQIAKQFVGESLIYAALSLLLALLLVELFLPAIKVISDRPLSLLFGNLTTISFSILLTLIVGLAAGFYPAIFLSSFRPAKILKGHGVFQGRRQGLRNTLVILQFAIAITLIVGTTLALKQLKFMSEKKLGFETERVLLLPLSKMGNEKYHLLKTEFTRLANVLNVTASYQRLGNNIHQMGLRAESADTLRAMSPSNTIVDYNFLSFYGIELTQGREFSKAYAGDSSRAFVVNEAFVDHMGWDTPIGKKMKMSWFKETGSVIGVVKNFHFNSLHHEIQPLVMSVQPGWGFNEISLRLNANNDLQTTISRIEAIWNRLITDRPFSYEFLDQHFTLLYTADRQVSQIAGGVTFLTIVIACLGLFGLSAITADQRTKEIGIRKTLGASMLELMALLTKNFAKLVIIAFVLSAPITYFLMNNWLQNFAYRVDLAWPQFLFAAFAALTLALLTVSWHAWRTANANPVNALKYE